MSAKELVLTQDSINSNFGYDVELLADAPMDMTAAEAYSSPLLLPYDEGLVNLGAQVRPAWMRFRLKNASGDYGAWIVNTLRTNVEVLEIYKAGDAGIELIFDNGDDVQRKKSVQRFYNLVAPLNLAPEESVTILVRFQAAVAGWLPMRVIPSSLLTKFTFSQFSLFIFSVAGTGVLIFFNLMLFLATRDRLYVLYTAATSALLMACMHLQGLTTAWWFYNSPGFGRTFGVMAVLLAAVLLMSFARRFLNLKGRAIADYGYWIAMALLGFHLICVPLSFLLQTGLTDFLVTSGWFFTIMSFVSLPFQAFFAERGWSIERNLLGTAWTVLAVQFVTLMLSTAGVLPASNVDWYLLGPACFTEASLVAVSIVLRVRRLQVQKEAADGQYRNTLQELNERARLVLAASHDARNLVGGALALNARVTQAEELATARSESRRVDQLLENLSQTMNLMVSSNRQVGPATVPMIEEIKVDELFETLALTNRERAVESGKSITWRTDGAVIACDRGMLVRVLSNFILNAIKYTRGKRILLVCRHFQDSVVLRVYDQGPGLTEDALSSILAKERQLRLSPQQEGVGVGLAICRDLVEAHGASLEARSRTTGGSMFGVRLPLPDLSTSNTGIEFVAEPELWERYSNVVRGSRLVSQPTAVDEGSVVIRSENIELSKGPGLHVVACFDRSQESRERWAEVADAILCFPVTLPTLAYAIAVARHKHQT